MAFRDYFSSQSSTYAAHRPQYPDELFTWLLSLVPACQSVWDAGTGNGQAARPLALRVRLVAATDASMPQLLFAQPADNITYLQAEAEHAPLAPSSIDLITVGQALHWFDRPAFYREARRTLRPDGLIAVWCYGFPHLDAPYDALLKTFYQDLLGPFWPKERALVDRAYADIDFPFQEITAPKFLMDAQWTLPQLLGYLQSWSAVQRFNSCHGGNAVDRIRGDLENMWGDPTTIKTIAWPLHLRVGRI